MNTQTIDEAVELFLETMPLSGMSSYDPLFKNLFEKECNLFSILQRMSKEELQSYRDQVKEIDPRGYEKHQGGYID